MPSPLDVPSIKGVNPDTEEEEERPSSDSEPFSALAFKIATDPFVGKLAFFRVYSGVVNQGDTVLNATKDSRERFGRIVQMHANHRKDLTTVYSGDIAAADVTDGKGVGKDAIAGGGQGLTFQIGANGVEDQRVTLNVNDMSATSIGVGGADVSTQDAANKAIEMVDRAVKTVSMQRAGLGALQNRLEYTVNNLTTTNENLTAAESQIRDTDMATEMINYTKNNILQQASQAMLAQANQQPQAILQLLQ